MKKVWMNVFVFVLMTALLAFGAVMPVTASETGVSPTDEASVLTAAGSLNGKEEVVYANLTSSGGIEEAYIVNILHMSSLGTVSDYGRYSSVKNLTSLESITLEGDRVTVRAPAGSFYYQGNLGQAELPWNVSVTYQMDGQTKQPDEIAGESGHLKIGIKTARNANAEALFYENYLLQVTVTLDTQKCENILAPGGTLANAGQDKLITFTVMPDKDGDLQLSADVTAFSMEGISLSAVPFSMEIERPDTRDLTQQMTSLSDAVETLDQGTQKLKEGAKSLRDGATQLKTGSTEFQSGLTTLDTRSKDLVEASTQIQSAIKTIQSAIKDSGGVDLSELEKLPTALNTLSSALGDVSGGMSELKSGFSQAYQSLNSAMSDIPGKAISQEALQQLYADNPDNQAVINQLVDYYSAASKAKATYQAVKPGFKAVDSTLKTLIGSVNKISSSLSEMAGQVSGALESTDLSGGLGELSSGLSSLSQNYTAFHNGLKSYTGGVSSLRGSYSQLHSGISEIAGGAGSLYRGVHSLNDGTAQLYEALQDAPEQVEKEIDKFMGVYDKSDFQPVSFVDAQNKNVTAVQFVMKTEKIQVEESDSPPTTQEEKADFWTRLSNLFR